MKNFLFAAMFFAGMLLLTASGCSSGSDERAVFARNMTDPAEKFTASTSGADNEILVIQLPGLTHADPENVIKGKSLTTLRDKGFKRVQIKGIDNNIILDKSLEPTDK